MVDRQVVTTMKNFYLYVALLGHIFPLRFLGLLRFRTPDLFAQKDCRAEPPHTLRGNILLLEFTKWGSLIDSNLYDFSSTILVSQGVVFASPKGCVYKDAEASLWGIGDLPLFIFQR